MSNSDFEVHPLGTSEELKTVRQFVIDVSDAVNASNCGEDLKQMVAKINLWYAGHVDRYSNV